MGVVAELWRGETELIDPLIGTPCKIIARWNRYTVNITLENNWVSLVSREAITVQGVRVYQYALSTLGVHFNNLLFNLSMKDPYEEKNSKNE